MILYTREPTSLLMMLSRRWNLFCFYKQIHGCAIGSLVSPVVANLCMEAIEESAISSMRVPPKTWKRYVDDSFVVIKKDCVLEFHDKLNSIDPMMSIMVEKESLHQISFLDTLVCRKYGFIVITSFVNQRTQTDIWTSIPIMRRNTK